MKHKSITYKIWESTENIIMIYIGSAADFALVEENNWLFFTNSIPTNPQLRFLQTFKYNQKIIFSKQDGFKEYGNQIREIHNRVEANRSKKEGGHPKISNEAFKIVGYMLIHYGIQGYEYLHHKKMSIVEKETYYQDIKAYMEYMHIENLPANYTEYLEDKRNLDNTLVINKFTSPLYKAYKKDMNFFTYWLLKQFQAYFVDKKVAKLLNLKRNILFAPIYYIYPYLRNPFMRDLVEIIMVKKEVRKQLDKLEARTVYS